MGLKTQRKTKGNYCFPSPLAKIMASISQRVQYEAALLSISFILLGLLFTGFITVFYSGLSVLAKIFVAANVIAGFIFLSSHLITTYQQYLSYLDIMGFLEQKYESAEMQESNNENKEI